MSDEDAELAAIRAKLRSDLMAQAESDRNEEPTVLAEPVEVADADFKQFIGEHDLVVVDCWAPWCGPCRIVGPIVDDLAHDMQGKVAFGKLNVDHNPGVSQAFGVASIPTLLVFKAGRLVDRLVGAMPKPQLRAAIERHLPRARGSPGPRRLPG